MYVFSTFCRSSKNVSKFGQNLFFRFMGSVYVHRGQPGGHLGFCDAAFHINHHYPAVQEQLYAPCTWCREHNIQLKLNKRNSPLLKWQYIYTQQWNIENICCNIPLYTVCVFSNTRKFATSRRQENKGLLKFGSWSKPNKRQRTEVLTKNYYKTERVFMKTKKKITNA